MARLIEADLDRRLVVNLLQCTGSAAGERGVII